MAKAKRCGASCDSTRWLGRPQPSGGRAGWESRQWRRSPSLDGAQPLASQPFGWGANVESNLENLAEHRLALFCRQNPLTALPPWGSSPVSMRWRVNAGAMQ